MSREKVIIHIGVDDAESSKVFKEITARLGALEKEYKKVSKESAKVPKETKAASSGFSDLAGKLKGGVVGAVAGVATQLVGMTAALGGALALTRESIQAFSEQDKVNSNLADSLARTGLEGEALESTYQSLVATAGQLADQTMFGDEDVLAAMSTYTQLTGEATASTEQMSTILGIAAKQEKSAEEAAKIFAKARKGEVEALKELTPLTKKQAEDLGKLTDEAQKSALAEQILAESFAGVAENADPTLLAINNLSEAKGDLLQKMGEVIVNSGAVAVVLGPIEDGFRFVEKAIQDNSVQIQQWIVDGVITAIDTMLEFTGVLADNAEYIASGIIVIESFGRGLLIARKAVMIMYRSIAVLVSSALAGLLDGFASVIGTAAELASAVGEDGLARDLGIARDTAHDLGGTLEDVAAGQLTAIASDAEDIAGQFDAISESVAGFDEKTRIAKETIQGAREVLQGMKEDAEAIEIKPIGGAPEVSGKPGGPAPPASDAIPKQTKDNKEANDEKERQKRLEQEIASLRIAALQEGDVLERQRLEYRAALAEIDKQNLEGSVKQLALLQADRDAMEAITALEKERAATSLDATRLAILQETNEERKAALSYELRLQEIAQSGLEGDARKLALAEAYATMQQRQIELAASHLDKEQQLWAEIGQGLRQVGQGGSREMQALADALASVSEGSFGVLDAINRVNAGLIEGGEATQMALSAAGGAAAGFADAMGASAAKQAGILALFEAASAAAAFATGLIPQGIQHSIAAATYAAVAATGAATSAKAPSSRGGGAPASSSSSSRSSDSRAEADRGSRLLAGAIASELGGGGGGITQIFDQRGALFGQGAANEVFDMAAQGARAKGMDMGKLRRGRPS